MIRYYIRFFWRNFLKNKLHFLLNLLGLTLGIICFILSQLFVFFETSFDNYHTNKDRIARIVTTTVSGGNETHTALSNGFLAITLPKIYPDIEKVVRFKRFDGRSAIRVEGEQKNISLENVYYADPGVFGMFSYPLIEGNKQTVLNDPNTIVLSRQLANRLFAGAPAIGRIVVINEKTLKVTGVMEEVPKNSDLTFEGLISLNTLDKPEQIPWLYTYILFKSPLSRSSFQSKLDKYTRKFVQPLFNKEGVSLNYRVELLNNIHFSNYSLYDTPKGNRVSVNIFLTTGILILIIAFTNSVNMTVVKSFSRSLEIAIQKIYGANRIELITQHILESVILGVFAFIFSWLLIWLLLPQYSAAINRTLTISDLANWKIFLSMAIALLVLGASGGVYTGFYLQQIQLADVLRSKNSKGIKMKMVPRLMLSFQFFISIGMIAAALVVYRQVNFMKSTPLGFNPKNVLVVELPQGKHARIGDKYLKNMLSSDPNIRMISLCGSNSLPGEYTDVDLLEYRENGVLVKRAVDNISVDANYLSLLQVPMVTGETFRDEKEDSASKDQVIVTSLFAKRAGWTNPIGQSVSMLEEKEQVIGVVPDFHFNSLHKPIVPLLIFQDPEDPAYMMIRVEENKSAAVIEELKNNWKKAFPQFPFYFYFLEQHLLQQYRDESNFMTLLLSLTSLIIIISCIGLTAYTSFMIRLAIFDIAIRRIVGASFMDIFNLFNRQFIVLLVISFLVACPASWYFLNVWLSQFSYHVYPKVTDYFIALGSMALIVMLVILYYSWKGIRINPARIIREQ